MVWYGMYVCMYVYVCMCVCVYIYIYNDSISTDILYLKKYTVKYARYAPAWPLQLGFFLSLKVFNLTLLWLTSRDP